MDPEEVQRRIEMTARKTSYPCDAILFVLSNWSEYEVFARTQVSAEYFCWRLHDQAIRQFGARARQQLADWRIRTTKDFGRIVYGLIEHGLMQESCDDKPSDFDNVFEFDTEFSEFKLVEKPKKQWRLSTMFVATTLAAIAIAGFSRSGLDGAFSALMSSWFVFLGVCCMLIAIATKSDGWRFVFVFGVASLAGGLFAFFTLSYW